MFDAPQKPPMAGVEIVRRIQKALHRDGDTHTWEDVKERIQDGRARIFYDDNGCWIVEVIEAPQARWLNAWIVAGRLPEVMSLQGEVEKYAEEQGCTKIRAGCRRGWKAIYPEYGWREIGILIEKEVGR